MKLPRYIVTVTREDGTERTLACRAPGLMWCLITLAQAVGWMVTSGGREHVLPRGTRIYRDQGGSVRIEDPGAP
jgi:hypothetical protein